MLSYVQFCLNWLNGWFWAWFNNEQSLTHVFIIEIKCKLNLLQVLRFFYKKNKTLLLFSGDFLGVGSHDNVVLIHSIGRISCQNKIFLFNYQNNTTTSTHYSHSYRSLRQDFLGPWGAFQAAPIRCYQYGHLSFSQAWSKILRSKLLWKKLTGKIKSIMSLLLFPALFIKFKYKLY